MVMLCIVVGDMFGFRGVCCSRDVDFNWLFSMFVVWCVLCLRCCGKCSWCRGYVVVCSGGFGCRSVWNVFRWWSWWGCWIS